jgi:hypothetical protein
MNRLLKVWFSRQAAETRSTKGLIPDPSAKILVPLRLGEKISTPWKYGATQAIYFYDAIGNVNQVTDATLDELKAELDDAEDELD